MALHFIVLLRLTSLGNSVARQDAWTNLFVWYVLFPVCSRWSKQRTPKTPITRSERDTRWYLRRRGGEKVENVLAEKLQATEVLEDATFKSGIRMLQHWKKVFLVAVSMEMKSPTPRNNSELHARRPGYSVWSGIILTIPSVFRQLNILKCWQNEVRQLN